MAIIKAITENEYFMNLAHAYVTKFIPRIVAVKGLVYTAALRRNGKAVGDGAVLRGEGYISDYRSLSVGANVHIGEKYYFKTEGGLSIGDNCHISRNVTIYTASHQTNGQLLPYDESQVLKPVHIGRNVWVGMNVCIAPGTVIGEGAVIGLGARVSGKIPPFSVIVSQKNRQVGERDGFRYSALDQARRYGGRDGKALTASYSTANGPSLGNGLFFIVSTGRSGSTTLAEVLNGHPKCRCEHEPRHNMIRISTDFMHGKITPDDVCREISANFIDCSVYPRSLVCGESDHKYGNLIPYLAKLMPDARFVWLIRDAEKVVASAVGRGWFDDYEYGYAEKPIRPEFTERKWAEFRGCGHLAGAFSEDEWRQMSMFERNCWYWRFWNDRIEADLKALPPDRWRFVQLETLAESIQDLQYFLGLPGKPLKVTVANRARHDKVGRESWSASDESAFDRWCADGMSKWYGDTYP